MDNSKARDAGLQWARQMVRLLIEQRESGVVSFSLAWGRAKGLTTARQPSQGGSEYDFYSFFRRACQREWNGEVRTDYRALVELADLLHHGEHQELSRNALVA